MNCSNFLPGSIRSLALAVTLALPLCKLSGEDLSNNLSRATGGHEEASGDRWLAASFSTGTLADLRLTSVTLLLAGPEVGAAEVTLHRDQGLEPGEQLAVLSSPTSYAAAPTLTSFIAGNIALEAGATYWIVLHPVTGAFQWSWSTDSTGNGTGFDAGWDVSNDAGATWFIHDNYPLQWSVQVNEAVGLFRRGDVNQDGKLDISDPVGTLLSLFAGGVTISCHDAADSNDDGAVDLSDAVAALNHLFLGGAALPAPGPDSCGEDPTEDALVSCIYDPSACSDAE